MFFSTKRIPSLDGLRALSITIVVASHTATVFDPKDPHFTPLRAIFANGQIGVAIFFVISGFLITSLLIKEFDESGRISLRDFYVRRAFRILPPYYAFLGAILVAVNLRWIVVSREEWVSSFLFYWNYVPSSSSWWLGHTWSLCVEEQFYLLWPLILVYLGRVRARRIAIWMVALSPIIRICAYFALPAYREKLTFFLSTRADALMIGCVLSLCWSEPWFTNLWRSIGRGSVAVACAGFIFFVSPALFAYFHFVYQMTVGYTLDALCIGVVLFWAISNPTRGFCKVLNLRPVIYLGVLSYSIYLWQQPFIRFQGAWITAFPGNILVILLCAVLSYYCIEQPALRTRKWLRHPKQRIHDLQLVSSSDVVK